jgi:hypothetical protein
MRMLIYSILFLREWIRVEPLTNRVVDWDRAPNNYEKTALVIRRIRASQGRWQARGLWVEVALVPGLWFVLGPFTKFYKTPSQLGRNKSGELAVAEDSRGLLIAKHVRESG